MCTYNRKIIALILWTGWENSDIQKIKFYCEIAKNLFFTYVEPFYFKTTNWPIKWIIHIENGENDKSNFLKGNARFDKALHFIRWIIKPVLLTSQFVLN